MAKQATAQKAINDLANAITGAQSLLESLKSVAGTTTVQTAPASNKSQPSQGSQSSAGRLPSEAQQKVRDAIESEMKADKLGLFTIKGLTERLGLDRVHVRNAVQFFETQGVFVRWAEKLPEGRGQRELVYKVASFAAAF